MYKFKLKASLTVEASLVLPVFIFTIIAFIYFLQILIIHNDLQEGITNVGLEAAKYGYVYDLLRDNDKESDKRDSNPKEDEGIMDAAIEKTIARSIDSIYFKTATYNKVNSKAIENSCVKDGFKGIHTYLSTYMDEDNFVDIVINYKIEIPLLFIKINEFQIIQRVKVRSWNGYQPLGKFSEDLKDDIVFITETGTVYHISKNCTHLNLSVKIVPFEEVKNLRNSSGGKYKNCNVCGSRPRTEEMVYITTNGDRYHNSKNCSGLKRTVKEVPYSQVEDRNLCKRCGK